VARGYVEPVPLVYARVAALAQMTADGLDSRGLLDAEDRRALAEMHDLALRLQTLSEKELRGEALTDPEYADLRGYGGTLYALTAAATDPPASGGSSDLSDESVQAAVVADVATDPNGQVLEEGTGRVFPIYVVAPIEGRLVLTTGGVYSHYEFAQPLADRLTDEAWRRRLDAGQAPPLDPWTDSYLEPHTAS